MAPALGWCAWCGEPVSVGVVIAETVAYHVLCWHRRAEIIGETDEPPAGFLRQAPDF